MKYTSNCTGLCTPSLLDYTLRSKLSRWFQVHSKYSLKYTSKYVLKYTLGHALQYAPKCTRWHTPSLLYCTLPTKLSRHSEEHLQVHTHVHILVRHKYTLKMDDALNCTWRSAPMYAPVCSIQSLAELQIWGPQRHEAGGIWWALLRGWRAVGGMWHVLCGTWEMAGGVCWLISWCQSLW